MANAIVINPILKEDKMHTNNYYIEMMLKERHQQFLAEAKTLQLVKTATSTGTQNKKTVSGFIFRSFETIRETLLKKREQMACGCPGFPQG